MGIVDIIELQAPLPLVALAALVSMIFARELGAALHRGLRQAADAPESGSNDEAHILAAVLGLLALLVAFTFSLALDRYETRRSLVVTEANALGTAYLRTAMLDDPAALRRDLRAYAQERLAYGRASGREQDAAGDRASRLQSPIWKDAMAATQPFRSTALAGLVLAPINEAFDTAAQRKAALAAHLPASVLATLAIYAVIAAGMLGYTVAGAGGRHRVASILMFTLLTLAIVLILDLDRPRGGAIRVPQTAMADALVAMGP